MQAALSVEQQQAWIDAKEDSARLREDLKRLLANSNAIESKIDSIELLTHKLTPVVEIAEELQEKIRASGALAQRASGKIKELDVVRERVRATHRRLQDIVDVGKCVEGVSFAMSQQDWDTAAGYVERYRSIDRHVLGQSSSEKLDQAANKLRDHFIAQVEKARADSNTTDTARYCGLLWMIGEKKDALERYSQYLVAQVLSAGQDSQEKAELPDSAPIKVLGSFFEQVASIISTQMALVDDKFGRRSRIVMLRSVQAEAAQHASSLIRLFEGRHSVSAMVSSVPKMHQENSDPRELGELLDALALLSSRCSMYSRFLDKQGVECLQAAGASPVEPGGLYETHSGLLRQDALQRASQETTSSYVALEKFFLVESVQKAINMKDEQASAMVDYVFFVLQKSSLRALSTMNADAAIAVLNILNSSLRDFFQVLQQMLRVEATAASRARTGEQKTSYAQVLNNVKMSSDFILRLKHELERSGTRAFPGERDTAKLESSWAELREMAKSYKAALHDNLVQVASTLDPNIRDITDSSFNSVTYQLSEADFAALEDTFVDVLCEKIEKLLAPFQKALLATNYDALVQAILRKIIVRLEKLVLQQQFNALGAIQFSKDVSSLSRYMTSVSQTIRAEFARLNQASMVLGVEQPSDVEDLASSSIFWRLTPGETRKLLSRRVDFTAQQVARVKL